MSGEEDIYYQKYLKYKAKYLALREQEGGLITAKEGLYGFFTTATDAEKICAEVKGKAPSVANINKALSKNAYTVQDGTSTITRVRTSLSEISKKAANIKKKLATSKLATGVSAAVGRVKDAAAVLKGKKVGAEEEAKASVEEKKAKLAAQTTTLDEMTVEAEKIKLESAVDLSNQDAIKEILGKINGVKSEIDTAVIINIKKLGSNNCFAKITL